jgi:hypothetical protein
VKPTDPSAGQENGSPDDDLVFAAHDFGRDRPPPPERAADQASFAATELAPVAAPAPVRDLADGFVIRETAGNGSMAPVDALVVGAPEAPADPAPAGPREGFRVYSSSSHSAARADAPLPWTVRDPSPPPPPSRRGWNARHSGVFERSAQDTLRRLREDAVQISWKAAWIAVVSADAQLFKRRDW